MVKALRCESFNFEDIREYVENDDDDIITDVNIATMVVGNNTVSEEPNVKKINQFVHSALEYIGEQGRD